MELIYKVYKAAKTKVAANGGKNFRETSEQTKCHVLSSHPLKIF